MAGSASAERVVTMIDFLASRPGESFGLVGAGAGARDVQGDRARGVHHLDRVRLAVAPPGGQDLHAGPGPHRRRARRRCPAARSRRSRPPRDGGAGRPPRRAGGGVEHRRRRDGAAGHGRAPRPDVARLHRRTAGAPGPAPRDGLPGMGGTRRRRGSGSTAWDRGRPRTTRTVCARRWASSVAGATRSTSRPSPT